MTNEIRLDCKMCGLKMYDNVVNEVWWVLEDDDEQSLPTLWRTEKDARVYAKRTYPDESVEERDLRICSEKILSYDNQYCADELDEGEMEEAEYD
jgi:hypothetical protein